MAESYPLNWPEGWARTRHRSRSHYKVTPSQMVSHLHDELRRFGARSECARAVIFELDGEYFCGKCDRRARADDAAKAKEQCK